ncbi:MAG: bifunctional adenosylcobinamide kinase/adenosylcobinamide-phosphate guanylyltransferase [Christensenellaceae bacterium]|jgi:adenosylcobinamide kinase/adenosylcobinamide-phosphate guanylyltransferase
MGQITFITGGARSGKSKFAQKLADDRAIDIAYVATAVETDMEMRARIEHHRASRPLDWQTYEYPYNLLDCFRNTHHQLYLVDCVTAYITNLLIRIMPESAEENIELDTIYNVESQIKQEMQEIAAFMRADDAEYVVVSNEVGMGIVPEYVLSRVFRDISGRANQLFAEAADEAYFIVSGIPMRIKP